MSAPIVPDAPYAFTNSPSPEPAPLPAMPAPSHAGPGRPRGSGAKRGRKPRGAALAGVASPRVTTTDMSGAATTNSAYPSSYSPHVRWDLGATSSPGASGSGNILQLAPSIAPPRSSPSITTGISAYGQNLQTPSSIPGTSGITATTPSTLPLNMSSLFRMSEAAGAAGTLPRIPGVGLDDEGEGDDELLPAMADDDYSAQLSWQSQSKDNLKCVMLYHCFPAFDLNSLSPEC